eukprot:INCI13139.1.p1 GENE.INCI13139.1~~INCI13139.1.p1  ORF type:complete len:520 (-),score=84.68 INCI13139.1:1450-3009(-)
MSSFAQTMVGGNAAARSGNRSPLSKENVQPAVDEPKPVRGGAAKSADNPLPAASPMSHDQPGSDSKRAAALGVVSAVAGLIPRSEKHGIKHCTSVFRKKSTTVIFWGRRRLATDQSRYVGQAIKATSKEKLGLVEATYLHRLHHHEHIVSLYWVMRRNGNTFMGMEQFEFSLATFLRLIRKKNLPLDKVAAVRIAACAATALTYMHDCGYVHGDVKPSNILLNTVQFAELGGCAQVQFPDRVALCDFDNAAVASSGREALSTGTRFWRAPELVCPTKPKSFPAFHKRSFKSDVWGLGAVCGTLYNHTSEGAGLNCNFVAADQRCSDFVRSNNMRSPHLYEEMHAISAAVGRPQKFGGWEHVFECLKSHGYYSSIGQKIRRQTPLQKVKQRHPSLSSIAFECMRWRAEERCTMRNALEKLKVVVQPQLTFPICANTPMEQAGNGAAMTAVAINEVLASNHESNKNVRAQLKVVANIHAADEDAAKRRKAQRALLHRTSLARSESTPVQSQTTSKGTFMYN